MGLLDVMSINKNLSVIKSGRRIYFAEHQIDRFVQVLYMYDLTTTQYLVAISAGSL